MLKLSGKIKDVIPDLLKLDMDKLFVVEVKEPKSKRSLEQNKMLWQLIHSIAKKQNQDDMEVYCALLERADALSDYIITAYDMEDDLRKCFRGVRFIRKQEVNGKGSCLWASEIEEFPMAVTKKRIGGWSHWQNVGCLQKR